MKIQISLREIVNEMPLISDQVDVFLNVVTGELVTVCEEDEFEDDGRESEGEDGQQQIDLELDEIIESDDYIPLPSRHEIHEYKIMESFCLSFPDEKISQDLMAQIRGSGAFRRFNNALRRYDLDQNWYHYRDQAFKQIAIEWMEENEIEFIDDMGD